MVKLMVEVSGQVVTLVPASEGRPRELQAPALQHHTAHRRHPQPLQTQARDGRDTGVLYPHLVRDG